MNLYAQKDEAKPTTNKTKQTNNRKNHKKKNNKREKLYKNANRRVPKINKLMASIAHNV